MRFNVHYQNINCRKENDRFIIKTWNIYKKTYYHIVETMKLKEYFDNLLGYNLYDLFPEIK